ncbi:cellulase family glycosylhydrolase [Paenibacillus sp. FSL R10-2782]|uniref:cellulase family glycosylhydrolase n=1 Tax=Paenibacillus sp. FSL R10-2782 TaxID=2954661 RepID=UPI0031590FE4
MRDWRLYAKKVLVFTVVLLLCSGMGLLNGGTSFAASGFYVNGTSLKDANGNTFVMRGVNNPHIWFDTQAYQALDTIAATKSNTVRIVWQTNGSAQRLEEIINRAKQLKLISVVELHDVTGSNDANRLNDMARYFAQPAVKKILADNQKYVLVNIANEWGDHNLTDAAWRDAYKTAITTLRNAGLPNTIVIDGSGWGQYASPIKAHGVELLQHDPNHNLLFSVHMYANYNDSSKIGSELQAMKDKGLAVIVGEFGYNYNNGNNNLGTTVNPYEVMKQSQAKGIGYLAWSWTGNNSENAWLDLVNSSDWKTPTAWGNIILNDANGIKNTSQTASVY